MQTASEKKIRLAIIKSVRATLCRNRLDLCANFALFLGAILFGYALNGQCQSSAASASNRLHFSAQPTAAEISNARVFDEPLIPIGGEPKDEENGALAMALEAYADRANPDDFSGLADFVNRFPDSRWTGSLLLHLGTEYYNGCYYSKALKSWEEAWGRFQNVKEGPAKAQADRALGELARMYSKVGRMQELGGLLASTTNRDLEGSAVSLISFAKEGLSLMQKFPGQCFRCGPLALDRIQSFGDPSKAANPLIIQSRSTTNGFSLSEVAQLSRQLGMNYQMAFRSNGASIILPAVIHWKVNHYAALLQRDGDRFLIQDHTFVSSAWVTTNSLNDEGTGYFLVPPGPLPGGWRAVSETEGDNIWGKGPVGGGDPGQSGPDSPSTPQGGNPPGCGMAIYSIHLMLASLDLFDTPVGYAPPVGPAVRFTASYHALEANQPSPFFFSNLGHLWTCNWIAYITDNPQSPNADVSFYQDGGGTLSFTGFNTTNKTYQPQLMTEAVLVKVTSSSYEMQFPNGSKKEFAMSDGAVGSMRHIFLTQIIDPTGNAVQLNYDAQLRITNVVDAIGQATTLAYTNAAFPFAITAVTDPFGRAASFQYNSSGLLTNITDVLNLNSQFTYGVNNFITSLKTPYGITTFASGGGSVQATDPLGQTEYVQSDQTVEPSTVPPNVLPHGLATVNEYLVYRNTFYWDKKAYADGFPDHTKATLFHWCHYPNITTCSAIIESEQKPLENRVWYNYPGELYGHVIGSTTINRPTQIGRVLDDGTTQLYSFGYNSIGNMTNSIDPVGRTFSYFYDTNKVDLLEVRMTRNGKNELQKRVTYNTQHCPVTVTDAAAQTTTNTYNLRGQLLSTINPKGEVTTFNYDTNGYLLNVTGHLQNSNDVKSYTYDGFGRVRTATDTEGYTLTYDYDVFDRKTKIIHPDGTFEQFVYDRLDMTASADRLGRWTTNMFDALRRLVQVKDPLGRATQYGWCKCGSMTSLTDPMARTTTWDYDVQSRPIAKHYVDGATVTYTYENTTSRLKTRRDEKGQDTVYEYYPDSNLKRVSYPNALVFTPTVNCNYDSDYDRVLSMKDGIGTTTYSYNSINGTAMLGAGQLASVSGPLPASLVTYQYDALERITNRSISGVAETTDFDHLGRPIVVTNSLGAFQYAYRDSTWRLASENYPNGQTNMYAYFDNLDDNRLQQIIHMQPNGNLLSSHAYAYNVMGLITSWNSASAGTNSLEAPAEFNQIFDYDVTDQLTNDLIFTRAAGLPQGNSSTLQYGYDLAGNRRFYQTISDISLFAHVTNTVQYSLNALNQLTVTVPAQTNSATYEWDAENRLTAINQGTNRSEFSYDGVGRRVRIVEKENQMVTSDNYYLWCGADICEVLDGSATNVLRRLFWQGESLPNANGNVNYYYTRDHLGSICQVSDSNILLVANFNYDPFGKALINTGDFQTTFGFTGQFVHRKTGLYLSWFRAFDSSDGRWLSRDPIGEHADINLYRYLKNNPVGSVDFLGLEDSNDRCSEDPQMQNQSPFDGGPSPSYYDPETNPFYPYFPYPNNHDLLPGLNDLGEADDSDDSRNSYYTDKRGNRESRRYDFLPQRVRVVRLPNEGRAE